MKRKYAIHGNHFSTSHQQISSPLYNKKAKERGKNTTQVVVNLSYVQNVVANDNTMDWFWFLGANYFAKPNLTNIFTT